MALIIPQKGGRHRTVRKGPSGEQLDAEAINNLARPAILVANGKFRSDSTNPPWAAILDDHRATLDRAISAVARVEADDRVLPFVGTAFLIDRRLAVTASYVAELILQRRQPADGDQPQAPARAWLNFKAEHGSDATDRIEVREIHQVHPYWGFAFLELERDANDGGVLELASSQSEEELRDRNICVIGYPALDLRNDPEQMRIVFGDIFDVKRLMPGKIQGMKHRPRGGENAVALLHDATTTGGTGGAPVIDIETGFVLGVQIGGRYLVENHAAPAWEIGRDPLWWRSLKDERNGDNADRAAVQRQAIDVTAEEPPILSFDEVIALHTRLMKVGVSEEKIALLFAGLPNEYVASLPDKGSPTERLLAMLHAVNNTGGMIRGHSAFYYLLKNGERMRNWDTQWTGNIQNLLQLLLEREKART